MAKPTPPRCSGRIFFAVIVQTVCGPTALTAVEEALQSAWSDCPWVPEDIRSHVEIAVAEIAANIVEHTGRGQAIPMEMRLHVLSDRVHVAFHDLGPPVQIDLATSAMPDPMAERGRGLAMARTVLDQLAYHHDHTGNHWTLTSRAF